MSADRATTLLVVWVIAALVIALFVGTAIHRVDQPAPLHVVAAAPTTTTTWPQETVPDLGPRFLELVAAYHRPSAPPRPRARTAPRRTTALAITAGSVNGYPCGGDLPPCRVLARESHGDPRIWNRQCYAPTGWAGAHSPCGGSTASGLWQFLRSTWNHFRGYLNAADAPPEIQNEKARIVFAHGAGCSHWNAC